VSTAGYLYAVAFSDGTVKIGRANQAHHRIAAHRRSASVFGIGVVETYAVATADMIVGERAALSAARAKPGAAVRAGEWFLGLAFSDAKACVDSGADSAPAPRSRDLFVREEFGARLTQARCALRMTQSGLCDALELRGCGVIKQTVSHWERGRAQPDLNTICHLAELLDVSIDHLLLGAPS
jgi:DNA-binding XRE family transcriptional regulator